MLGCGTPAQLATHSNRLCRHKVCGLHLIDAIYRDFCQPSGLPSANHVCVRFQPGKSMSLESLVYE
jgi:hypothetical protein